MTDGRAVSRLLRFPYPSLEELRADELAILEDLAETRRRIGDLLEGERRYPGAARRSAQDVLGARAAPFSSSARRRP